jgi:peptide-methionine (S)-S-oxide reductase
MKAFFVVAALALVALLPADSGKPVFLDPAVDDALAASSGAASTVVAGGCFWGVQAVFQHLKGVTSATSGYAGGTVGKPSYEMVSSGTTGHAESVRVVFDPSVVTYGQLLKIFFSIAHDPTELNRQGPDEGTQYRSAIFFETARQHEIAAGYVDQLNAAKVFRKKIVTEIKPLPAFYQAEAYHQNYATLHPFEPYIMINDRPKVDNLRKFYPSVYVEPKK